MLKCKHNIIPQHHSRFITWRTNIYLFWKNKVRLSKNWITQFLYFSKKTVKMTLNGFEINKYWKNNLLYFRLCLHNFLIFTFLIFRIIFGRTCYDTTVCDTISITLEHNNITYLLWKLFLWITSLFKISKHDINIIIRAPVSPRLDEWNKDRNIFIYTIIKYIHGGNYTQKL